MMICLLTVGASGLNSAAAQSRATACLAQMEAKGPGVAAGPATTQFILALQQELAPGNWNKPVMVGPYKVTFANPGRNPSLWSPDDFDKLIPAATVPQGELRKRLVQKGKGAAFVGIRTPSDEHKAVHPFTKGGAYLAPVSVVVEFGGLTDGREAVVYLYNSTSAPEDLEADFTAPVEIAIKESMTYRQATMAMLRPGKYVHSAGLQMPLPYQPGKIPVVFVHGLDSAPRTWENVYNELGAAPSIREHYQFWFFRYPTGEPVPLSAAQLRQSLQAARAFYDPKRKNKSFEEMVIIGHSMGGMLTRMQVTESGDAFWNLLSTTPFDQMAMPDADRDIFKSCLFFQPQPFVKRVVFVSTPHKGSNLASGGAGLLMDRFIQSPVAIMGAAGNMANVVVPGISPDFAAILKEIPTGLDNLKPENGFVRLLQVQPVHVPCHSLIGTQGLFRNGKPVTDGVVPYWSSHLDCAQSEFWVPSGHEAHNHPMAVPEFERILKLHLGFQ
ncbi:MAG: hypothetical protein K1X53_16670 [Candidatus Sumerlaeaceae bacterium]|nr:hypothetical protein [Candidatus Sumerlaeaceae bacterium]